MRMLSAGGHHHDRMPVVLFFAIGPSIAIDLKARF